jgi:hypothetical protein
MCSIVFLQFVCKFCHINQQDGFDDPLDYPNDLDEMMGRTFAFRIKWQKDWRQGSVLEIKDNKEFVQKLQHQV